MTSDGLTAQAVADLVGGRLLGDGGVVVTSVYAARLMTLAATWMADNGQPHWPSTAVPRHIPTQQPAYDRWREILGVLMELSGGRSQAAGT